MFTLCLLVVFGGLAYARAADDGLRRSLYSHSLGIVMCLIFLLSWLAQSVTGGVAFNEEHLRALQAPISWGVSELRRLREPHAAERAVGAARGGGDGHPVGDLAKLRRVGPPLRGP
nr:DUF6766 family protein [Streptomyces sp. ISL-96]